MDPKGCRDTGLAYLPDPAVVEEMEEASCYIVNDVEIGSFVPTDQGVQSDEADDQQWCRK